MSGCPSNYVYVGARAFNLSIESPTHILNTTAGLIMKTILQRNEANNAILPKVRGLHEAAHRLPRLFAAHVAASDAYKSPKAAVLAVATQQGRCEVAAGMEAGQEGRPFLLGVFEWRAAVGDE